MIENLCQLSRGGSVAIGYVAFFAYVAFMILGGEFIQKKFNWDPEIVRKLEHIATGASWIIAYVFIGLSYHLIIINGVSTLLLGVISFGNLMKSTQRTDTDKSYGLLYFGISSLVIIIVAVIVGSEKLYLLSGITYYCMVLGDGLAPLVARLFKKANFVIFEPKTFVGMMTVIIMSTLSAVVFNAIFDLQLTFWFMLSVGCLAGMTELYGRKGWDNITVEIGVFAYMMLYYYGLLTDAVMIAVLISPLLSVFAGPTKSITLGGSVTSFVYTIACAYLGGLPVLVTVYSLFVISAIVSKISTKIFNKRQNVEKAKTPRGATQIIANSAIAVMLLILYKVTNHDAFLWANYVVLCEEFADSCCSDLGRLSKKQPMDVLRWKRIQSGISGGVSLLGSVAGLFGCAIAIAIPYLFGEFNILYAAVGVGIAFVGTFVDSILGSGLQALYKCETCGNLSEKDTCCDTPCTLVKGTSFVTNSLVNFASGAIVGLAALAIALFVL